MALEFKTVKLEIRKEGHDPIISKIDLSKYPNASVFAINFLRHQRRIKRLYKNYRWQLRVDGVVLMQSKNWLD